MTRTHWLAAPRSLLSGIGALAALSILSFAPLRGAAPSKDPGAEPSSRPRFVVQTVDETKAVGPLLAIGPDWAVSIGGPKPIAIAGKDIALLEQEGEPHPVSPAPHLVIQGDGTRFHCRITQGSEDDLQIESEILGPAKIRMDRVRALLFAPPRNSGESEKILRQAERKSDLVVFRNGDQVAGTLDAVNGEKVKVQGPLGEMELDRGEVAGVYLNPQLLSDPEPKGLYAQLLLRDGSRLTILEASIQAGGLLAKPRFNPETRVTIPLGQVAQLSIRNGRQLFLSDIDPKDYRFEPYFADATPKPYRRDLSFGGHPLRLRGRIYPKGLGVHSGSTLVYALDGKFRRFTATLGVDDEVAGRSDRGLVVFRVLVDGVEKYVSPALSCGDVPRELTLDVAGAKTLSLINSYPNFHDTLDHADWAAARLVR